MPICPIHGPQPEGDPDDEFSEMVSALVTLYLLGKDIPTNSEGQAIVSVHAQHDDDHNIFLLKIGLGLEAHAIMAAEHEISRAGGEPE